jgi:hypothetical protein
MLIHKDIEAILYSFAQLDGSLAVLLLVDDGLAALLEDVGGDTVAKEYVHCQ